MTMTRFVPGHEYQREDIFDVLGEHQTEGSFLLDDDIVVLIAKIGDSVVEPHLPDRSSLFWPGQAPAHIAKEGVSILIFVELDSGKLRFLGTGRPSSYRLEGLTVRDVRFVFRPALSRVVWCELLGGRLLPNLSPPASEELAELSATATPEERWAALKIFVERWYQRPLDPSLSLSDALALGPPLLHRLLELSREVPELFTQNQLVAANELVVEDGRVVFLIENQGVCHWAIDPVGEDPRVWYRLNEVGALWLEEPERLSMFMVQAVLLEATLHAPFGASATAVSHETRDAIRAHMDPIGAAKWNWCGHRFFARDGALALIMETDDQCDVCLGACSPLALAVFEDLVTEQWDNIAF